MNNISVLSRPWAIKPEVLNNISKAFENQEFEQDAQVGFDNVGGVAVISIHGVMSRELDIISKFFGLGVSTTDTINALDFALADSSVDSILLHIDSPGGTVDGTQLLSKAIAEADSQKPVTAFVSGSMNSAAYWAGSAAGTIIASSETDEIGSIGVVAAHIDTSKAENDAGIKVTEITAGKFKRAASQHEPLSDEGREVIQDHIDQIYRIFVRDVADNRGVSVDKVLSDMADGRVFLSQDALERGLIDDIKSFDDVINSLTTGNQMKKEASNAAPEVSQVTMEILKASHGDLVEQIMAEGAAAERERIKACDEQILPGYEKMASEMKYSGAKPEEIAMAIVKAEKNTRASKAESFVNDAPQPVNLAPIDDAPETAPQTLEQKWEQDSKLQAEFGGDFNAYKAYEKFSAEGRLNILGRSK